MNDIKRYHPLIIVFELWKLVRNSAFFALFLFVLKYNSEAAFVRYGRIAFIVILGFSIVHIFIKWFTHKYKLDDTSFHIYKGIFTKSKQTIPFINVQNVNRHTSLFHRIFKVTSLRLATGMEGSDATIEFTVISPTEADNIERRMCVPILDEAKTTQPSEGEKGVSPSGVQPEMQHADRTAPHRMIHFKPTKKDVLKASFTSLSFLILIPLLGSLYTKVDEIFNVEKEAEGLLSTILSSWWLVTNVVIGLIVISVSIGIIRTFLKYGEYEISSDTNRIYIKKGVVDSTSFSISKQKVQAIEITQSTMKRMLGLVEVKLISAGGTNDEEDKQEINTLYPFLPVTRAYKLISEILPSYEVTEEMTRLPQKSLWVRMLKPSWFWLISTGALYYFKPKLLGWEHTWWVLSIVLFVCVYVSRLFDFFHTRFTLNHNYIQIKTGALTTSLFVSRRDKVIEVKVTRNLLQQRLGLASIETVQQAKPVCRTTINDVPIEMARAFYTWYLGRTNEINVK
ncbi:PH domain-containing protein [Brevibacillus daliensis]|uniref:PH domain-containing protein n=1 Tax=Brevibacillus daliensis TaxID=2892995 RepID=UPI001E46CE39|nr:PH domain-containing protein [Brevibacillus daliensis]